MTAPTITELPDPPSRGNAPEVFIARADAFLGALPAFGAQANALALYFDDQVAAVEDIVSSAGYSGTSTSAIVIGTGSKSFFTQANLSFVPGVYVSLADSAAPTVNSMVGTVTAYNRTSGAMTVNVSVIKGAGEKSSWSLSLSGPPGSDAAVTGPAVISALGYTPVNKAGDTMTGPLTVAGIVVGGGSAYIYTGDGGQTINVRTGAPGADRFFSFGLDGWINAPNGGFMASGNPVYNAGNDGAGSGLDADLLRGMSPSVSGAASSLAARNASGETEFGGVVFLGSAGRLSAMDANTLRWNLSFYLDGSLSASVVTERSDRSLKENTVDLGPVVGRLRPVRYRLKGTEEDRIGFIAQEVEELNGLAVSKPEDGPMEVRLTGIIAILSAQLNDALDRIERLEGGT